MPDSIGKVAKHEARNLDRVIERNELDQIELDGMRGVLKAAVTAPMAGDIGCAVADRLRGRRPKVATLLVPNKDRFARRIDDGIVRPRRQLVLAAVFAPGVTAALRRDLETKARIRDDVDPRCRC